GDGGRGGGGAAVVGDRVGEGVLTEVVVGRPVVERPVGAPVEDAMGRCAGHPGLEGLAGFGRGVVPQHVAVELRVLVDDPPVVDGGGDGVVDEDGDPGRGGAGRSDGEVVVPVAVEVAGDEAGGPGRGGGPGRAGGGGEGNGLRRPEAGPVPAEQQGDGVVAAVDHGQVGVLVAVEVAHGQRRHPVGSGLVGRGRGGEGPVGPGRQDPEATGGRVGDDQVAVAVAVDVGGGQGAGPAAHR